LLAIVAVAAHKWPTYKVKEEATAILLTGKKISELNKLLASFYCSTSGETHEI